MEGPAEITYDMAIKRQLTGVFVSHNRGSARFDILTSIHIMATLSFCGVSDHRRTAEGVSKPVFLK
jgi:hypothetical protein